jgi:hypothetical protein
MGRVAGSALVGAAVLFSVPGGAAGAATLPQLPIASFTQVIADSVHNELFLGTNANIVVTNLTGTQTTTWAAAPARGGMAFDGTHVYAANGNVVDAFSALTPLAAPATYQLPAGATASSVAFQFGRIWVSYSTATVTGAIGYFTVNVTNTFHANILSAAGTWTAPPRLAADPNPATEGTLVAVDGVADPTMIATYNVSGNAFNTAPVAENDAFAACTGLKDLAVKAGGGDFTLACSGQTGAAIFTTGLAPVGGAAINAGPGSVPSPDAVTYAPDSTGLALGSNDGAAPSLSVFKLAGTQMTNEALGAANEVVAPGGLSWASDAVKLYAVLKSGANYFLDTRVYAQYLTSNVDLMNTGTGNWVAGNKLTLKGSLTYENAAGTGTTVPPLGTTVRILRRLTTSTVNAAPIYVKTGAGGAFTVTDTPPAGNYFYVAYYPGTGTNSPGWHTVMDKVTIGHTTLKVTASSTYVKTGTTVTITATLGKWHTNKTVTIYGRVGTTGGWTALRRALVSPKGILTVSVKVSKKMQFTAKFTGDGWYAAANANILTVGVHS